MPGARLLAESAAERRLGELAVAALRRRDADAAEKAMREHVRYGANSLRLALGRLRPER